MSDLILNINFEESKKKNRIVIETYEGSIPKLKSKKYSGQLRNVNINTVGVCDNMDSVDLMSVRDFLNKSTNIQISKYQYMLSTENVEGLDAFISLECMFYRDKKNDMYQIETIEYRKTPFPHCYSIENLQYAGEKTKVFFKIEGVKVEEKTREIIPKAYIDLNNSEYPLDLQFDYGSRIVDYLSKERSLGGGYEYRDFAYEDNTRKIVEECGWRLTRSDGFAFSEKDIGRCIARLSENRISVFTNTEKKIVNADFSNIQVSYNFDWFDIKGKVNFDCESVDIENLIDLKKRKENWVEYNGKIIFLPSVLSSKAIKKDLSGEIRVDKKQVSSAIAIAHDINGSKVHNLDSLIDYNNVKCDIDNNIAKVLRDYQYIGVKWLLSLKQNDFGACLADDMGLGKTLQIIAFLSDSSMKESRSLVIVPKTLLVNWKREVNKFSPGTSLYIYHGTDRNIEDISDAKIVLSTYQTVVNDISSFCGKHFDNLIIDEAQYIKNSKSKAYNAIKCIDASMKILLTGTPIENNLEEFWGLMRLINPDIIETYSSSSQSRSIDRIKLLSAPFLLRRLKRDVLKDLPEKQEQMLLVKMDDEQQALYDKMLESIRYEILRKNDRFEMKSNSIMLNGLLYLQEICCHPQLLAKEYADGCTQSAKLELLIDLLKTLYSNGHKVVVFSRFTKMLAIIKKKIVALHMKFYYLDGATKDRMNIIDEFEKNDVGVFLVSLKAGGTGINLTSADTAIIYDPWWNPASEKQAEDRIYRIGQKKKVMIYRLIVQGTIEEKIQKLQDEKMRLCADILDGHEIPVSMTAEVMEQLLLN